MKTLAREVPIDDLIDSYGVAELLGLKRRSSVSVYQARYPDMPKPVIDLGPNRAKLWRRSEITAWVGSRKSD